MPDMYSTIAEIDPAIVEQIANAMEVRAANPQQRNMLDSYLSQINFPDAAQVLEVGCGTGPVVRRLASWPRVGRVTGLDPSPILLSKAMSLSDGVPNLIFKEGDGRALPFDDEVFDVVIFHTTLCHVPQPEKALAEAYRVLRSAGQLVIFDGDYATITVANGENDLLQQCVEYFMANFIHDIWLMRRLPKIVSEIGFSLSQFQSFGYLENSDPTYMLTLVDRGADTLVAHHKISETLASELKAEARRRVEANEFFGYIAYASLIAQK